MEAIALRPVDAVAVTTLVDNVTDSLLPDQGPAARPSMADAPRIPVALFLGGDADDALRGEYGFAALVTVTDGGRDTRVLFDAGRTPDGLVENMRRLRIDPRDIDVIPNCVDTRFTFAADWRTIARPADAGDHGEGLEAWRPR